jgi:2,4-diketo-3-deoxy-L-fuconate hydrolase
MPQFALGAFKSGQSAFVGLVFDQSLVIGLADVSRRLGKRSESGPLSSATEDLLTLLLDWDRTFEQLLEVSEIIGREGLHELGVPVHDIGSLIVRPPIAAPPKLLCVASNYADHVAEMRASQYGMAAGSVLKTDFNGVKSATRPYAFLKAQSSIAGPHDDIVLPAGFAQVDWEAELAVVIGRQGKRISETLAGKHIAGFMTCNDISCRDAMWRPDRETLRSDWLGSKSFDTFAPLGPLFVPAAFVPNHMQLRITCKVNGEVMQSGSTAGLIFSPEEQISYFSRSMTLCPGDIFVTGTPGGVGQSRGRFLTPGDILETEVQGLGLQRNRCVAEDISMPTRDGADPLLAKMQGATPTAGASL